MRTRFFNKNPRVRAMLLARMIRAYRMAGLTAAGLRRNRVQFLVMHEVLDSEEESFCNMLDELRKRHRFIGYSEAVDRIIEDRIDAPYLALSFDDGFASCKRTAALLKSMSIPACFFVCPSIIGETDDQRVHDFCRDRLDEEVVRPFLTWRDLDSILRDGHEVGGHTMTHPNLAKCRAGELRDEIGESYSALTRALGQVRHFAWPFGHFSHISPAAVRVVFQTGYRTCASAERGCHVTGLDGNVEALCIRRDLMLGRTPFSEIEYFLARNSRRSSPAMNGWPFENRASLERAGARAASTASFL